MSVRAALLLATLWCVRTDEDDATEDDASEALTEDKLNQLFSRLDTNKDGKVSVQEIHDFHHYVNKRIAVRDGLQILEEVDTSKDGKLSLAEHIDDMPQHAQEGEDISERKIVEEQKFKAADKDGDGLLDVEELPALFSPTIDSAVLDIHTVEAMTHKDKDKDGKLSPVEFFEVAEEEYPNESIIAEDKEDFDTLDKNRDGFIDLSELRAWESGAFHTDTAIGRVFNVTDKDRDMHLTAEELINARDNLTADQGHFFLAEWVQHLEL